RFEVQRATVKNERGQRVDNVPYGLVSETFSKNLYPYGHPYSWEVIGYIEDLNRGNVDDLKNFFLRWYGPNNATLTIGGDVKTVDVVKMVEKYFGTIPRCPEVKPAAYPTVQLGSTRYASFTDNYARLPLLVAVFPTVPNYHKDMAALQCLSQILGQGRNSVLYQQLTKKQLALQASAFSRFDELAGEFIFQITPMAGKSLGQMDTLFHASLDSFEQRGVSEEDIAKFKGSRESQLINGLQSVQGKVTQLASFQTFTGNPNKIADLIKSYSSLTREDVLRVYNTYIKGKGAVILSVTPKGQENLIAAKDNFSIDTTKYVPPSYGYDGLQYVKAKDNFDRKKLPGSGENPTVKVPKFWRKDLANGARVIGTENTEIPTVTFSLVIPGGHLAAANDFSKAGLASFYTNMMTEDTKNYTAEQLSNELQKLGSSINISSSTDAVTYTVQSLKKNFDKTLTFLQERLFNPKFTQQSFDRLKQQALQTFKAAKGQPATIANNVFAKVNYGSDNILGISEDGTEETVKNFTLKDIEDYYSNYLTSQDAKVVIVGDIKEEEVLPKLAFLDKLPKKKIVLQKPAAAPPVDKTKVYMVDVPKGAQTEFRVGYATGLKYDATGDYYKSFLANFPLGGGFNSRLNMELREEKGWTYGASSRFSGDEYSGEYRFSSGIKADVTDSALAEVMKEITEYLTTGPTADEIVFMKGAVGQSDALRYETGPQKAQFIRRILDYNLPANYTEAQAKILKNITKEDMLAVAHKYLDPAKMNILLVGDKAKIAEGVKKLGYPMVELDADGKVVEKKGF
ncbi:MAG: pitrilysin family protein, partial [Bacteroidota bacterium]